MSVLQELRPVYIISNENQRWETSAVPNVKSVLTVAASGDQALFYRLSGATMIDTFDIAYNAGIIQDVKRAAIKTIELPEYRELLLQLHNADDVMSVPNMKKLEPLLTQESREIIKRHQTYKMFGYGCSIRAYPYNIPTDQEYQKLRTLLDKPFPFVQSELKYLHKKLTKSYDAINLSNILETGCYTATESIRILTELTEHLNIGGHIVCPAMDDSIPYERIHIKTDTTELVHTHRLTYQNEILHLMQRVR